MSIKRTQRGFALIEVLVTAVILAIGISGLGMLIIQSIQTTQDSSQQSQGMWMVQDYVGRIKANAPGARQRGYVIDNSSYDCIADKPALICADLWIPSANGSSGYLDEADICLASEMADFDRWTTLCSVSSEARTYSGPSDFMVNPVLTSECTSFHASRSSNAATGLRDCVQYQVSLSWDTKAIKGDDDEDLRIRQNSYSMTVELN